MAAIPLFGHTEMLHTPIGMGSAALAAAVRGPEFHGRDNEVLKTNKNFFFFFFYFFLNTLLFVSVCKAALAYPIAVLLLFIALNIALFSALEQSHRANVAM